MTIRYPYVKNIKYFISNNKCFKAAILMKFSWLLIVIFVSFGFNIISIFITICSILMVLVTVLKRCT